LAQSLCHGGEVELFLLCLCPTLNYMKRMGKTYELDIMRFERDVARAQLDASQTVIKALQHNLELSAKIIAELQEIVLQIEASVRGENPSARGGK
jgi:hypothetical protein